MSDPGFVTKPLPPDRLRPTCDPGELGFETTDDVDPVDTLIGQARALDAIRFGTEIDRHGYNLFVLGETGHGRHTAVRTYLEGKAATALAPDDWVYVHNFETEHQPRAMRLPPGEAVRFRDAMSELIDDLNAAIPAQFQSEDYHEKRRAIDTEFEESQETAFDDLRKKAEAQSIAILRTPMGFALAPTSDGQVVKPDVFNALPEAERRAVEAKINDLQKDLAAIVQRMPFLEKQRRDRIRDLNAEQAGFVVDAAIVAIRDRFPDNSVIADRLDEIRADLVEHTELFLAGDEAATQSPFPQKPETRGADPRLNRYRVNVMVSNDADGDCKGAPIVIEDHPRLSNLVGRVEHLSQFGALVTDFTMIRPGALHRANGGYLVLDARKILSEPFAWDALKRALRGSLVTIVSAAEAMSLASTVSLQPEPIPLSLKVVLIGDRLLYYLLSTYDPDFGELFKVEADFDDAIERNPDAVGLYARLIATMVGREKLRPFDAAAVARAIDEAARLAEDAERLTLRVGRMADLLREADYWAADADRAVAVAEDVDRAVREQQRRGDRIRERSHEAITRQTVLIDTDGMAAGQINGLSVISLGRQRFGQPTRITARVRMGAGKVVDIERETKLGGPLHSKGVLILSSYLAATYALDLPMSLWASIVFEQSYGGVDGDSASSAELYALLSALSGLPLRQSLAVTGSVNQHGQVQAIGGVNEKIEGFFDICSARGLTGDQAVLIPAANVKNLMLRSDIVEAASAGRFRIHAVAEIAEGIELLTGVAAGARDADGRFPPESVNGRVEARLREFAERRKSFAADEEAAPAEDWEA